MAKRWVRRSGRRHRPGLIQHASGEKMIVVRRWPSSYWTGGHAARRGLSLQSVMARARLRGSIERLLMQADLWDSPNLPPSGFHPTD